MKWKEGADQKAPEGDAGLDYMDDDAYSPWRKAAGSGSFFDLFKPSYLIAAVVVFVIVIIGATLIPKGRSDSADKMVKDIDSRLKQVEARLAKIESSPAGPPSAKLDDQTQQVDRLRARVDRLETALTQRVDDMAKQIHKPAEAKPAESASKSSGGASADKGGSAPVVKSTPAAAAKGRTHQVQAGETLYGIGRRYSVPVEVLCRLNNIPAAQCKTYQVKLGETLVVGGN